MSVIRELAAFVVQAQAASLPDAERAIQRRHVADTAVAAVAGRRTAEGRALLALLRPSNVADAAAAQAAVIRHTEIDDIHTPSCTTPSSVTVPCALALARASAAYGDAASAIWVGTELMTRLGAAIDGARVLYKGIWPTYFAAPLGAAAVAARVGHLTEDQTAHALSLALMLTAGRSGRFHSNIPGRSVILAMAVANGIRAADAARQGVGGDHGLLDGEWLRDAHGLTANVAALTDGLGKTSCYSQMSLKPFCTAKQALAAVEALMDLLDGGIPANEISKVTVRVPPPYARMIAMKPEAGVRSSTFVSAAFQMGLAAYHRDRLYDIERAGAMQETDALAFAGKVEIVADASLLESFPTHFPTEVEVVAGGKTTRRRVTAALGDPGRTLDEAALTLKAQRVFEQIGEPRPALPLIALGLRALDNDTSCEEFAEIMANTATNTA